MRSETRAEKDQRMRWWRESTFGLFVHFGLFAIPAGYHKGRRVGRGTSEWIMHSARIPDREYAKYAEQFNPVGCAPAWQPHAHPHQFTHTARSSQLQRVRVGRNGQGRGRSLLGDHDEAP